MVEGVNNEMRGLSSQKAKELQEKFGRNELASKKKDSFVHKILEVLSEPMFLLLIIAAIVYFLLGEPRDGSIMLVFVLGIISIDAIQEWKTDRTLKALKELSAPKIKVIRDGEENIINSIDLVPGDVMMISEGVKIPADGEIIKCSDLCIDESSLTGEAEGVWKVSADHVSQKQAEYWRKDYCYAGTLVIQGSAMILVDKIGVATEYGKIGMDIAAAPEIQTPLQKQTGKLTKVCAGIAILLLILVGLVTYINISGYTFKDRIIESILSGITLAMAMIPEEFPVILTVFLSMGAWRLAKKHSLVRKLPSVETLGAVSVLCVDKTGTITINKMTVTEMWPYKNEINKLSEVMGMGCEIDAYDPMEKAMLSYCENAGISKEYIFEGELITEYPFTNETKIMAHVWKRSNKIIVAAKGSPEKILELCKLSVNEKNLVEKNIIEMSQKGLRVIGVAEMIIENSNKVPESLFDCSLQLVGMVGLSDPPRDLIEKDIEACNKAGIRVVMITGDNGVTASAIASKIGIPNSDKIITGDELNKLSDEELREKVRYVNIFSRVIPEHKMRIVKAFKENGQVVAMTGDGVNDAPALKYADIGIAMGKRGSEVSREAADLILLDDNFSTIVDTVKDGRRIYDSIRKAVGYVFTIHIPIALISLLGPLLGISPNWLMLLPIHVVLLELIIDPTCSIVLERQPSERNIMLRPPRDPNERLLTVKVFAKSLSQGMAIFAASFGTYLTVFKNTAESADMARTMGLAVIMLSNILLVQVNSSNYDFAYKSFLRMRKDKVMWAVNIGTLIMLFTMMYTPINSFLKLMPLSITQLLMVLEVSFVAVMWYELVKFFKSSKNKNLCNL